MNHVGESESHSTRDKFRRTSHRLTHPNDIALKFDHNRGFRSKSTTVRTPIPPRFLDTRFERPIRCGSVPSHTIGHKPPFGLDASTKTHPASASPTREQASRDRHL